MSWYSCSLAGTLRKPRTTELVHESFLTTCNISSKCVTICSGSDHIQRYSNNFQSLVSLAYSCIILIVPLVFPDSCPGLWRLGVGHLRRLGAARRRRGRGPGRRRDDAARPGAARRGAGKLRGAALVQWKFAIFQSENDRTMWA